MTNWSTHRKSPPSIGIQNAAVTYRKLGLSDNDFQPIVNGTLCFCR